MFYWPPSVPREETVEAFVAAFEYIGYEECPDGSPEGQYEKIALYVFEGTPTHAARQGANSATWLSKLGTWYDIEHENVHDIVGSPLDDYGEPQIYMRRLA